MTAPTRTARTACFLGLVGLALGLLLPGVPAVAADAPKVEQRATFGIQPATAKGPDQRPYLLYPVAPGASLDDHVAVVNYSRVPLTLRVYATDAYNGTDGSFSLLDRGVPPKDAGTWLRLQTPGAGQTVTVRPRSYEIVPVRLSVPATATPGDHVAGIVAALTTRSANQQGTNVELDQRVGVRTFARVNGPLRPRLTVEDLRFTYEQPQNPVGKGHTTVRYTVHNTGNVTLGGSQRVTAQGLVGPTFTSAPVPDLPALVPDGRKQVETVIEGTWPLVWMTGTVQISPAAVNGIDSGQLSEYTASTHFWAVPWVLIALLVGVIGLDQVRRRRRPREGRGRHAEGASRERAPEVPAAPAVLRLATALLFVALSGSAPAWAEGDRVPYTDAAVTGGITLCGVDGKPVLSGKVSDKPFVWTAIGDTAADEVYSRPGRTAFLVAYQPRQNIDPGAWSGYQLNAASRFDTVEHPTAQSTPRSSPLFDFTVRYTPQWDGYVQLRLLLAGSDRTVLRTRYDAADIRVVGDTWHLVRGGRASCTSGKAVSTAVILNLPGAAGTPSPGAVASPPPVTTTPIPQTKATGPTDVTGDLVAEPAGSSEVLGASLTPVLVVAGLGVAAVATTVLVMRRRS